MTKLKSIPREIWAEIAGETSIPEEEFFLLTDEDIEICVGNEPTLDGKAIFN